MEILESNKLIAGFMELKGTNECVRNESGKYYDYHATPMFSCIKEQEIWVESECGLGLVEQDFLFIEDLKFHSSYDWLMQVVEKIESLVSQFSIKTYTLANTYTDVKITINSEKTIDIELIESKIQAVYQAVIEFIKWYNTNTE